MSHNKFEPFIVKFAKFAVTRLLDENGNFQNGVSISEAKQKAKDAGLDLVCFNEPERGKDAFCKIIDYGKWKYMAEKQKKKMQKEHRKGTKELRFSPNIDPHDVEHKIKQAVEFLEDGDDVIFSMRLKGRQRKYYGEAEERLNDIVLKCSEIGKEVGRKKSGNSISIRLGPINKT